MKSAQFPVMQWQGAPTATRIPMDLYFNSEKISQSLPAEYEISSTGLLSINYDLSVIPEGKKTAGFTYEVELSQNSAPGQVYLTGQVTGTFTDNISGQNKTVTLNIDTAAFRPPSPGGQAVPVFTTGLTGSTLITRDAVTTCVTIPERVEIVGGVQVGGPSTGTNNFWAGHEGDYLSVSYIVHPATTTCGTTYTNRVTVIQQPRNSPYSRLMNVNEVQGQSGENFAIMIKIKRTVEKNFVGSGQFFTEFYTKLIVVSFAELKNIEYSERVPTYFVGGLFKGVNFSNSYGFSAHSISGSNAEYLTPYSPLNANFSPSTPIHIQEFAINSSTDIAYVGGTFLNFGGASRNYLSAFNTETAQPVAGFAPTITGTTPEVTTLVIISGIIYFGGVFTSVNSTGRTNAAAVNSSGTLQSWAPTFNNKIFKFIADGTIIYACGMFTTVNGNSRFKMAAVSTGGTLQSAFPPSSSAIWDMVIHNDIIYVCGSFTYLNSVATPRSNLGAIRISTRLVESWAPTLNDAAFNMTFDSTTQTIYVAGQFLVANGQSRQYLAAFDLSGNLKSWYPQINDYVRALGYVSDRNTVWIGGKFTIVNGQRKSLFVEVDKTTGSPTNHTLSVATNNSTQAGESFAYYKNKIFTSGGYDLAGGTLTGPMISLSDTGSINTTWSSELGIYETVYRFINRNGILYTCGYITDLYDGTSVGNLVALSEYNGSRISYFNPLFNDGVFEIVIYNNSIYCIGDFTTVNGVTRNYAASVDLNGNLLPWNPDPDYNTTAIAEYQGKIYISGWFSLLNGGNQSRAGIARVDASEGIVDNWFAECDGNAYVFYGHNNIMYIGGSFTSINNNTRNNIAAVNVITSSTEPWNPDADYEVYSIDVYNNIVYIGGTFNTVSGQTRNYAAAINVNGTLEDWDPNCNNDVNSLKVDGNAGLVYLAGRFTTVGGQARNRVAAVTLDNTLDSFTASLHSYANKIGIFE